MGGPAISAIAKLTEKAGIEDTYDLWTKAITSGEAEGMKSKAGQWVTKTFANYITNTKKEVADELGRPGTANSMLHDLANVTNPKLKQQLAEQNVDTMNKVFRKNATQNRSYHFGPKDAWLSQAIAAAKQERGTIHANNLRDMAAIIFREEHPLPFKKAGARTNWMQEAGVKTRSPYKSPDPEGYETKIKNVLGLAYLGRVVIPHTMQHLNSAITMGIKPWAEAMVDFARDPDAAREFAWNSGAMYEEVYRNMRDIAEGKDTIWHKVFHMPGFSKVRQLEIIHAALAGKHAAMEAAADGGRSSQLLLKTLGLDPVAIAQRGGKLTPDELLKAGYKSADENLFLDRGLKTPWKWDSSSGWRMMTLYKAFQFREGKLIKDSIKRSFQSGDPVVIARTLGLIGGVFPVAGELISMMENAATARDPLNKEHIWRPTGNDTADEYLDAMGHMAAFGIWYSLFRAAFQHRATDWMTGPVVSLGADFINSLVQLSKGNVSPGIKSAARRVPVVGPAIAAHVDDITGIVSDTIDNLTQ